jgi:phage terminase small subunit
MGKRGPKSAAELQLIGSNRATIAANRVVIERDLASPPDHLSSAMKQWFASVISDHEQIEPHQLLTLQAACEAWDRSQQAREALKTGLTYSDERGMLRARPEIAIERDSRIAFVRCVRELKLDIAPPTGNRNDFWLNR